MTAGAARLIGVRLLQTVPALVVVSLVVFGLLAAAPGDPARSILASGGAGDRVTEAQLAQTRHELGLDRPLWVRYADWAWATAHLDLGRSYLTKQPVTDMIASRLPASAALTGAALALAVGLGVPLGVIAAAHPSSPVDVAIRTATLLGPAMPAFWLGLMLAWLLAAQLHVLPAIGDAGPSSIVLPAVVLALPTLGLLTRLVRATVLEASVLPHVRVAMAKGMGPARLLRRHVVPNAMPPVLSVIGLDAAALTANTAVVEWLFAWPGLGGLGVRAALSGDVPVVMGFVLIATLVVVAANLLADIAAALIDPRLRR